jgi:uncharacterized protein YndB with AHSA1/START domain
MRTLALVATIGFLATAELLHAQSPDLIVTEGLVKAPVDTVWRAWTTKEGIESWMVAKTDIELRVGALWRTSYNRDSNLDDDGAIHQEILAFDPGKMLSFRTIKPPKGFPFPSAILKTWTVVYFEPVDGGQTKITARMLGYTEDAESQKMRAFFERGNQATLDSFVRKIEGSPAPTAAK